jgi:hypothetical protein
MPRAVKYPTKDSPTYGRDDGSCENLVTGKIGVEVDIGSEDEMLTIITRIRGQGQQVVGIRNLIWVGGSARPAGVFGYTGRGQGKD